MLVVPRRHVHLGEDPELHRPTSLERRFVLPNYHSDFRLVNRVRECYFRSWMPAKPRPRDEARRARTDVYRQHVVEAAERVFAERGFETAKLQEISRLAGLSMGTIY